MPLLTSLNFDGPQWDEFTLPYTEAFNRVYYFKDDNGAYADMQDCTARMVVYDDHVIANANVIFELQGTIVNDIPTESYVSFDMDLATVQALSVLKTNGYVFIYVTYGATEVLYISGNLIFKGFL